MTRQTVFTGPPRIWVSRGSWYDHCCPKHPCYDSKTWP
jgi:hypothetical protein